MYTMDDAEEDMRAMFCRPCAEFKSECPDCGVAYCCFCEFECEECI